MGRQPIEEIVDEALQHLLDGESAEAVLARYPEYANELESLLFAASTLKQIPQPQLPTASLAAIMARAKAQAAGERKTAPVIVPPTGVHRNGVADEIERETAPRKVAGATPTAKRKSSWTGRIAAWMRPPGLLSRAPAALALALILLLGVYAASRLVNQPRPPVLTVPTVSSQFTLDGTIEQMASDSWLVGGSRIFIDSKTVIIGTPSLGSQAHIEGEIGSDNRRTAQTITIVNVTGTARATVASIATAKVNTGPTVPLSTMTVAPGIVATSTVQSIVIVPPGGTQVPVPAGTPLPAGPGTATTRPGAPAQATRVQQPTVIIVPTGVAPARPTATPVAPTETQTSTSSLPTATAQPSNTSVPQIPATSTAEPEPTDTRIPEPGPSSTPTEVESPTAGPSHTPEPEPTGEPTEEPSDTPAPQPSATTRPTAPPEPEDSPTPQPTAPRPSPTSSALPTATTIAPTLTAVVPTATATMPTATQTIMPPASPTRTEVPQETETAQPTGTGEPEGTNTAQPSETTQPTRTSEPTRTSQPTSTGQPEETHTAEPTGSPVGTYTPDPTHSPWR